METSNQNLRAFLKEHENKQILILTKSNLHYKIKNFKTLEDSILFLDRDGDEVVLALDQIAQATKKW